MSIILEKLSLTLLAVKLILFVCVALLQIRR